MPLDYSTKKKVKVQMHNFVEEILKESPEDMKNTAATPAANHIFSVDEKAENW